MADFDVNDLMGSIANAVNEAMDNNQKVQVQNVEIYKDIKDMLSKLLTSNMTTSKDLNKVAQTLNQKLKLVGGTTASADVVKSMVKEFQASLGDKGSVATHRVLAELTQAIIAMRVASEKARTTGKGEEFFKVSNQKTAQRWDEEIAKSMGAQITKGVGASINRGIHGIISFFGEDYLKKNLKGHKTIADSIVSGLASHKFIGGALTDGFRLLGLKIASWTRQIPFIGKYMAPVVFGIVEALAPILTVAVMTGIVSGFSRVFAKALPSIFGAGLAFLLGGRGRALGRLSQISLKAASHGHPQMAANLWKSWFSGAQTAQTAQKVAQTAASTGTKTALKTGAKVATKKGLGKFIPGLGIAWDVADTVGAAKEGKAGAAMMSGIGAVAGIAALVAGIATPVGLILGGVSLVASLIGTWKRSSEESQKQLNENVEDIKKASLMDKISEMWGKFKDRVVSGYNIAKDQIGNGYDKVRSTMGLPTRVEMKDEAAVEQIGSLGINKYGAMTNIGKMDKMQASEAVRAYQRKDPTKFGNTYELVGSEYADLGSFINDLAIRNTQGQATSAVLYKGAVQDLEYMRSAVSRAFEVAGIDPEKAKHLKYTSGMSTSSSPHSKNGGHSDFYGRVTDLGAGGYWSDKDWEVAFPVIREAMKKVYDVKWEGVNKMGGTYFGNEFRGGLSNRHLHMALTKEGQKVYSPGVNDNLRAYEEQQQAIAEQKDISIKEVIEKGLTDEERNELEELRKRDKNKTDEQHLKDMGIETQNALKGAPWVKSGKNGYSEFITDPTGNVMFSRVGETLSNLSSFSGDHTRVG